MVQFWYSYIITEKIIALTSLVAQMVRSLPAMQETWVWSLGWEDPLEKEMATHSSILAWKTPWTEEITVHGVAKSRIQLNNWIERGVKKKELFPYWWNWELLKKGCWAVCGCISVSVCCEQALVNTGQHGETEELGFERWMAGFLHQLCDLGQFL